MRFSCGRVPGYDRKSCKHKAETGHFRVLVGGMYLHVCKNAYEYAKSRRMKTSRGRMDGKSIPFDEKIPSIRLNHV